jgi:tetratricopeptide (TPR) repeat protein
MDIPVDIKGLEGKDLLLRVHFFRKPQLIVNETIFWLVNKRFTIRLEDGRTLALFLKRRFLDPVPNLTLGSDTIVTAPGHRWYTFVILALPLLLIPAGWRLIGLTGSVIGTFLALAAVLSNTRILRFVLNPVMKHLISGGVTLGGGVVLFASFVLISIAPHVNRIRDYEAFLKSIAIPEIHGGHHQPSPELASDSLHLTTDRYGYLLIPKEAVEIPHLLKMGQTEVLDSMLTTYQKMFEREFRYEYFVARAFRLFEDPDSSLEVMFDSWIVQRPNSFAAREARAHYYYGLGYANRGARWASETTAEQFAGMEFFFQKAEQDARQALMLEPRLLIAYELLMDLARTRGETYVASLLMTQATQLCPYSYRIRECFMYNLLPRWGGSYEGMEEFADECQDLADVNPKMRILLGYPAWDVGRLALSEKQYNKALQLFTTALSYGEHQFFLNGRGLAYWSLHRYAEALPEFEKAISYSPFDVEYMLNAARMLCFLGRYTEALKRVNEAEGISPKDPDLLDFRDWAGQHFVYEGYQLYKNGAFESAIDVYSWGGAFNESYAQTYFYRGMAKVRLQQFDAAELDFKEAVRLDPTDADSHRMLNWIARIRQ